VFGITDYLPVSLTTALAVAAGLGLFWWLGHAYLHKKERQADMKRSDTVMILKQECEKLDIATAVLKDASDSWVDVPLFEMHGPEGSGAKEDQTQVREGGQAVPGA